jgi:hypothetical protein
MSFALQIHNFELDFRNGHPLHVAVGHITEVERKILRFEKDFILGLVWGAVIRNDLTKKDYKSEHISAK